MRTIEEIKQKIVNLQEGIEERLKLTKVEGATKDGKHELFKQIYMLDEKIALLKWVLKQE